MILGLIAGLAAAATAPANGIVYRRLVPLGATRGWFLPDDYPAQALTARAEGSVRFAVTVGTDGTPTACRILKGSGNAGLDDATCRALMARARFHPMVDRQGRPTTGVFENVVRWHLPTRATEEISDRTFDAHAIIAPSGEVVECTISGSGSARFGDAGGGCGPFGERSFLASAIGANYPKVRSSHVRLQLSYPGKRQTAPVRTPDVYQLLAEAEVAINGDGTMGSCTSLRPLQMPGRSIDLCSIVAMAPPRFPAASRSRTAVFVLDLSADYH